MLFFCLAKSARFHQKVQKTITFFIKGELDVVFVSNNYLRKSVSNEIGSTKTDKNFRLTQKQHLIFKNSSEKAIFQKDGPGGGAAAAAGAVATKTCLDTTLISRRVTHARTHATQTQTRNTISRLGVRKHIHPTNLEYY